MEDLKRSLGLNYATIMFITQTVLPVGVGGRKDTISELNTKWSIYSISNNICIMPEANQWYKFKEFCVKEVRRLDDEGLISAPNDRTNCRRTDDSVDEQDSTIRYHS